MKQILLLGADTEEVSKAITALALDKHDVDIIVISHDDLSESNSLQKIKEDMIIFGYDLGPYIKMSSLMESTPPELFGRTTVPLIKKVHHKINHHFVSRNRNIQRRHVPVSRHK